VNNDTRVGSERNEPDDELMSQVSTFESLMIQALANQLTDIVEGQGKSRRINYQNQLIQAQTLQSLAQTALMLTDAETIFLHGGKLQSFFNRVFLEHTLGAKAHDRIITKPIADDEPDVEHQEPGDPTGES
jgi:hypothetical protein